MKRTRWFAILLFLGTIPVVSLPVGTNANGPNAPADAAGWQVLFNGKDLSGWETWLGRPHKSVEGLELKKNQKGEYAEAVGLDKDPKKVYSVVMADGEPALRISGEIFGALTSKGEYGDYHLRVEFKWGEKKWPPRENAPRDSGILYHCVGEHGAHGSYWMQSLECQVQEHDCGDFWSVAGAIADVEGELKEGKKQVVYKKGGKKLSIPSKTTGSRVIKAFENEKPVGEWNTMEVLCLGGTSVHVVNGKAVMVLTNLRRRVGDKEMPLTRGKIQLQSEGAEVFYRNIVLKPITALPEEYR